ncbi:hypothetical protein EV356DRAFT_574904 [Viridothelium virens]|uniref:Uncharacterized protein n=1 Tax=Viridothelium virens TaxID=1048519 RepID=A0A6A6HER3_VIRVR|nr:hypothetical protein EV356DRAFT_574904 [Viridothelium virens]
MSAIRATKAPMQALRMRATPIMRVQPSRFLSMRATAPLRRAVPKEEHSAHTISQRLRTLKKIPPELIPLGVVLAAAILAAIYSMLRKFWVDKTLRLSRQGNRE